MSAASASKGIAYATTTVAATRAAIWSAAISTGHEHSCTPTRGVFKVKGQGLGHLGRRHQHRPRAQLRAQQGRF